MHQCVCWWVDRFSKNRRQNVLPTNGCLELMVLGAHAIKQWGTRYRGYYILPENVGCTQHIAVIRLGLKPDHTSGPVEWRATEPGYRGNSYKARVRSEVQTQIYRNAQAKLFTKIAVCVCVCARMCAWLQYVFTLNLSMTTLKLHFSEGQHMCMGAEKVF